MSKKREMITVTVFSGEQYDGDWPTPGYPATLVGAIEWFQDKLAQIPNEYKNTARCEIDSVRRWEDSHYGHIEITYSRPETDAEMAARLAAERARQKEIKARELATLAALQKKYSERPGD